MGEVTPVSVELVMVEPELVTTERAAQMLGLARSTFEKVARERDWGPRYVTRSLRRWHVADLRGWARSLPSCREDADP
jgi:hypothetical protein